MTAHAVIPMRATVFDEAFQIGLSAGRDWPRLLGAAETLSQSPNHLHTALARHIRDAYSLELAGLLKPVDPTHRDRSDRLDQWKEAAIRCEEEETPLRVAMQHRPQLLAVMTGWLLAGLVAVALGVVL